MLNQGMGGLMRRTRFLFLLSSALLAAAVACSKSETPQVETKSETKSTNPDGSRLTTTTESKQVGSTLAVTTETKQSGDGQKMKTENETVIGTVTEYGPGKNLVILTGDGKKHDYDLADKKTVSSVDSRIAVGTKVRLDSSKDDSGNRSFQVVPVSR
jgi:ABC-type glycerol-3-phosphate transport system substrate-binding protein